MATNTVTIKGYLRDGKIEAELPDNAVEGEIELRIVVETESSDIQAPDPGWSDEELGRVVDPQPKSGAEIVASGHTGGWEHKGIEDSVEWIKAQRARRRESRGW